MCCLLSARLDSRWPRRYARPANKSLDLHGSKNFRLGKALSGPKMEESFNDSRNDLVEKSFKVRLLSSHCCVAEVIRPPKMLIILQYTPDQVNERLAFQSVSNPLHPL